MGISDRAMEETGDCGLVCETKARADKTRSEISSADCLRLIVTPSALPPVEALMMVMERRSDNIQERVRKKTFIKESNDFDQYYGLFLTPSIHGLLPFACR